MYQALNLKHSGNIDIPSERTVYRIMEEIGISHHPRRKPNGITKADREAQKAGNLLKRDFSAEKPLTKCVDVYKRQFITGLTKTAQKFVSIPTCCMRVRIKVVLRYLNCISEIKPSSFFARTHDFRKPHSDGMLMYGAHGKRYVFWRGYGILQR